MGRKDGIRCVAAGSSAEYRFRTIGSNLDFVANASANMFTFSSASNTQLPSPFRTAGTLETEVRRIARAAVNFHHFLAGSDYEAKSLLFRFT